jgi:hypothetical protein
MKLLRITVLNAICACLFLTLLLSLSAQGQSSDSSQWGSAVDGIQMSISDAGYVKAGIPKLRVTFRNLTNEDTYLYLGTIGGGGARPCNLNNRNVTCTFNFNLNVTDARGATRQFKFRGMDYIAGSLSAYVIYLQAHSTYSLDLGMDQFWSPETKEYELKLDPGSYQLSLQFDGQVPERVNGFINQEYHILDQRYIEKTEFWKGKLQSNTYEFKLKAL